MRPFKVFKCLLYKFSNVVVSVVGHLCEFVGFVSGFVGKEAALDGIQIWLCHYVIDWLNALTSEEVFHLLAFVVAGIVHYWDVVYSVLLDLVEDCLKHSRVDVVRSQDQCLHTILGTNCSNRVYVIFVQKLPVYIQIVAIVEEGPWLVCNPVEQRFVDKHASFASEDSVNELLTGLYEVSVPLAVSLLFLLHLFDFDDLLLYLVFPEDASQLLLRHKDPRVDFFGNRSSVLQTKSSHLL